MKNKLWFRAKHYGWGWYPCSWEGWAVIVVGLIFIFGGIYVGDMDDAPGAAFLGSVLAIGLFLFTGYKKGEKPRWRWGK